ncbi:MAG: Hsp33 family molecular chaperone HslO [Ruminococcaceae bacterium]|nr:Hsp33 family molecular chaperone HslO [Oscillospiraceae bacterium]
MSDVLVRGQSIDGAIRVFVGVTTDLVNKAHEIHNTSPVATAALGRTLTVAAIMGQGLKNETDSVTLQFRGDGPIGNIVAVTDSKSQVRGYVVNPYVDLPLNENGKLDVGGAVGKGYLHVIRDLSMKEPYSGQVPIITGEIAEDVTYYYAKSEQIPTAIGLGVLVGTDNRAICAGGFMIQLMPEATEEVTGKIEDRMKEIKPITEMLERGMTAEDMLFYLTEGFDMLVQNETVEPKYQCKCSKKRMHDAVVSVGKKELRKIIDEDGECEVECQFCNSKFVFDKEALEEMYKKAR